MRFYPSLAEDGAFIENISSNRGICKNGQINFSKLNTERYDQNFVLILDRSIRSKLKPDVHNNRLS